MKVSDYIGHESQGFAETIRAAAYGYMLRDCFPIRESHARELRRLGLNDKTIIRNGYASIPSTVGKLVAESALAQHFDNKLIGIAGFYRDDDNRFRINLHGDGLLTPVRNGFVRGVQVYRNLKDLNPYWLSSRELPGGMPAHAFLHFTNSTKAHKTGVVCITDNSLIADIFAERTGCCAVGLNGVGPANAVSMISAKLPQVCVALIMLNTSSNEAETYLPKLLNALRRAGISFKKIL
jgi:hypothetical protein